MVKEKSYIPGRGDIVWLTSGTVTLEAALYETPLILGYRSNWLNYSLYLLLKRINFIGLPNIISNERLVPELIQQNAKGENYFERGNYKQLCFYQKY